ncbi:MAG: thymidylate synthase [Leisingera sp.]
MANDVESVAYDPANQTLTVTGVGLDETPFTATYVRKPALDRVGYEAYTVQDNALTEHSTAYVRQTEGGYAAVVVTGGQFGTYQGGTTYGRTGSFDAPDTSNPGGIVSYAGTYVGLLNIDGDGGDLITPTPGTPTEILPGQSAEITGDIFINADFTQNNEVKGRIYNRQITDQTGTVVEDLNLVNTAIESNGSFTGAVEQDGTNRGEYGGVFSGTDAAAVAGSVHATNHIAAFTGNTVPIEEYGVFVLGSCDGASPDPVCNQPTSP